jgi:2-methylisocitrate lyase-like PEP mutase family enzyme
VVAPGGRPRKNSAAFGRWLATSAGHSRVFSTALASVYGPPGDAWDVASACLFEACGIQAVGTTSAGMAAVLAHADTEAIPLEELAAMVRRIVSMVRIPGRF